MARGSSSSVRAPGASAVSTAASGAAASGSVASGSCFPVSLTSASSIACFHLSPGQGSGAYGRKTFSQVTVLSFHAHHFNFSASGLGVFAK